MADKQIPWFSTKIECPVCGYENSFEIIKQGSYTESGRDTDFAPQGRIWKNPAFQKYNPILYFAGTCENCCYTREISNSFREWQKDAGYRTYRLPVQKKKHLDEIAAENSLLKSLAKQIDYKNYPDESTIIKLLMAIYDELFLERPTYLDLARFYIRIAWIYREMSDGEIQNVSPVQITMRNIRAEVDRLNEHSGKFDDCVKTLSQLVGFDLGSLTTPEMTNSGLLTGMIETINAINGQWSEIRKRIDIFQSEFDSVKSEIEDQKTEATAPETFHNYSSFNDFLVDMRKKWNDIPLNESEALYLALDYYLKSYLNSKEIKPGLQQLQASYMIGELSRRVGSIDQAAEYFRNTSKQAHEMMNRNRNDKTVFANAQKILEMSLEQARLLRKPEMARK